jgi:hypothetical protein
MNRKMIGEAIYIGTGYDYLDLPGLGNNNKKSGLPERKL